MTTSTLCHCGKHVDIPCINRVEPSRPFDWLGDGLTDFARSWPWSLSYGLIFAAAGYLLVYGNWTQPALAMALTTGFLLLAPFLAIGFYDLSLRREHERLHSERLGPFSTVRHNLGSIGLFGFLLAFIFVAWERISAILIGLYLGSSGVPDAGLGWLFSLENPGLLFLYGGFGILLAVVVFSLSVVSLPMLMDRQVDIVTALMTSLWVVWVNRAAMLLWAVIIVSLTALGVVTWFVGLAVIFPILGHATWHAYRDLVPR